MCTQQKFKAINKISNQERNRSNSHQSMEKDEDEESSDGPHGPASAGSRNCREERGAVIAEHDGVVGDAYNGEHEEDHD